jgi:hypothetical protein
MKAYGGVVGGEWSASRTRGFTPGERAPGTHLIGCLIDSRAGLKTRRSENS